MSILTNRLAYANIGDMSKDTQKHQKSELEKVALFFEEIPNAHALGRDALGRLRRYRAEK